MPTQLTPKGPKSAYLADGNRLKTKSLARERPPTNQKVGSSNLSGRTTKCFFLSNLALSCRYHYICRIFCIPRAIVLYLRCPPTCNVFGTSIAG
jgi:hypothetical protein